MSDLSMAIGALDRAVLERDAVLAGSVLDVDFAAIQVAPAASTVDRAAWLAALREDRIGDHEVLERFVHEDGDTAAVLHQVQPSGEGGGGGAGLEVVSDVWRRRADGWRLWRRHRTPSVVAPGRTGGPGDAGDPHAADERPTSGATVTEVAAVLAAIADAGHDPAELTAADMEEYVEAFRALKHQGDPA